MGRNISPQFKRNVLDAVYTEQIVQIDYKPDRIRYFAKIGEQLSDYAYWFLLGTLWVEYSGWSDLALWQRLFSSARPTRADSLMKPDELRAYRRLPETLTVYRAHRPNENDWIAYTLDPETAKIFAWKRGVSRFAEYQLPKSAVVSLFLRRGEKEVICVDRSTARLVGWHEIEPCPDYLRKLEPVG